MSMYEHKVPTILRPDKGGDQCVCHENTTLGFWQNDVCTSCLTGFILPDCLECDTVLGKFGDFIAFSVLYLFFFFFNWGGDDHCSIPCTNGSHAYDWDGTTGNDDIIPEFTCVVNSSNSLLAWFGYSSFNSRLVSIPVGAENAVDGAVAILQTTDFRPGFHQYAFSVGPYIPGSTNVTWTLVVSGAGLNHTVSVPDSPNSCDDTPTLDNLADVSTSQDIGYCKCSSGFYGASCTYECPGGTSTPCSNHGDCRKTDGYCLCQSRWTSVIYDYNLYDQGYRDPSPNYTCNVCSQDWYGDDCSTALLNRTNYNISTAGDSNDYHALVSSSAIVTLDGASLELVEPGPYRLLDMAGITMDGYFRVRVGSNPDILLLKPMLYPKATALPGYGSAFARSLLVCLVFLFVFSLTSTIVTIGNITLTYTFTTDTIRVSVQDGPSVVLANVQGEIILGLSVPANATGVTGLLGNADGDWVNDVASGATTLSYTGADLQASNKAQNANTNFQLNAGNTILSQTDLSAATGSGGYAMFINSSATVNVTGLPLVDISAFTIELWVKIPDTSAGQTDLVTLDTSLGQASLYVSGAGRLTATFGDSFTSSLALTNDEWTYVALSWDGPDNGQVTLHKRLLGGAQEDSSSGLNGNSTIQSITALQLGGAVGTSVYMDYIRVFDKVLLILLDEGGASTTFTAQSFFRDIASNHTGTIDVTNNPGSAVTWPMSDVTFLARDTMSELDAVVTDHAAISACRAELENSAFTTHCTGFGSIHQLLVENCISDFSRASHASDVDAAALVKLTGSALAFYCQAVTQTDQCEFAGYLDFCVPAQTVVTATEAAAGSSGGAMLFAIAGAVGGLAIIAAIIAACCCCCPKALCGRKKIFDSSSEEEEEEEELPEEEQQPPVQDANSTTALDTAGLKTAAGVGMVSGVALTMREPGKMSLGEEKPFEPLHKGRWTAYGWLPGARPVEGVSTMAPDEMGVDQYGNPVEGGGASDATPRPMTTQRPPTATALPGGHRPMPPVSKTQAVLAGSTGGRLSMVPSQLSKLTVMLLTVLARLPAMLSEDGAPRVTWGPFRDGGGRGGRTLYQAWP
ncbi:hypothetical protein EGW08_010730 [Elysia chlorotica]|uniref:EGF-like domain-containing protein n=1 Tax=Elysia chlorotica TaxID=188477 RepID=A0A3S1HKQ7_ELYCH|nr:hypothetical protein EGW08_010730 [Elysia chlorotica]